MATHGHVDPIPRSYDAVLYLSFGGPEGSEDVLPFLERVTAGRDVPRERLLEVAEHYELFGGVSPLNPVNRAVISALCAELERSGPRLPVYWANRNWHPFLRDTLRRMADDGITRAAAFVTAAYSSYSSCGQYLEDIARARAQVGAEAPEVDKLRVFYDHPGFVEPQARLAQVALHAVPQDRRRDAQLLFVAHSIPLWMARASAYVQQLQETARLIAARLDDGRPWDLVWQSRSGPPQVPWLEPDINDHLPHLAERGVRDVVVVPIGFVADHLEVRYDLDVEAAATAADLGLNFVRAATVGADPDYVRMIRDLVVERMDRSAPRLGLSRSEPAHDVCAPNCCR